MGGVMACTAEDQGLPVAGCHAHDPWRFVPARILLEVFERSNVMHLDLVGGPTPFTHLSQKPLFEL
jgi:hypothetical protein